MTSFIHENFMLQNEPAIRLYHDYAKKMPIIDFHCHLNPKEIRENHQFTTISEIWLYGDHYKWRAMRAAGFTEDQITGSQSDKQLFSNWSKTVPQTIGNPLYHWTHLELKRYFDLDELLNEHRSEYIWKETNERLQSGTLNVQDILQQSQVKAIFTTDDPCDDLAHHQSIAKKEDIEVFVKPTFRPDKAIEIGASGFAPYMNKLENVTGMAITHISDLLAALTKRMDAFEELDCRASDHGIQTLPFQPCAEEEAAEIFKKRHEGKSLTTTEIEQFKTYMLLFLGKEYHRRGWVMQLHIGAIRNNNHRQFDKLGPDTGFDSIHDFNLAEPLNGFLNNLDVTDQLPKMIIYPLNPIHSEVVATAIGNFQSSGIRGKLQLGSGWWFNDQKMGMRKQLTDLSNHGLLSTFVGMLTDSRSFLSFTRHEYFRRILCTMIGEWVMAGEVPEDYELLGNIIKDICYYNAVEFFDLDEIKS
ncbi:glucuronate isomerase [Paenalkalicoccus suaedae]|uniref:Uronate isomerase n=1 Tax=Paenalkalicoccus suaedae TaxID=2592382 RepID=A0A859FA24_9BACI|nr:glucuronate isomerase [Paenalkalicoccus suaedae]QKS69737.1 glucuronate isomerase [Paenalkalicoccus suaedae]